MINKSEINELFWLGVFFTGMSIIISIFQVLFYYTIASFYAVDPSLSNTAKDILVAFSLKGMQLNVKAFIYIGLFFSLLNLPLWAMLKGPTERKRAVIIGVNTGLLLSVIMLVRITLTVAGWGNRIMALGVVAGVLFVGLIVYLNVKFHLFHQTSKTVYEFCYLQAMAIVCLIIFMRLAVFDSPGVDHYWPMIVFIIAVLVIGALTTYLVHHARLSASASLLRTEKLFWILIIAIGLSFGSGSIWRWRIVSEVLAGSPRLSIRQSPPGPAKMPNIILIILDTVRADHLSLYGYERKTTPFLDSLGKDSVVFDHAYATAPNTIPSHAGIFTGLYSAQSGCHFENTRLAPRFPVLAEQLNQMGYFAYGMTNNGSLNHFNGFSRGFDLYEIFYGHGNFTGDILWNTALDYFFPETRRDSGAMITEYKVKKFLASAKSAGHPFFLFVNYMEAHQPYPSAKEAFQFFNDPETAALELKRRQLTDWDYFMCVSGISDMTRDSAIKWYDGAIYYLDTRLAKIYEQLKRQGLLDNTIIIVSSDHGEGIGEHGIFGHMVGLYENNLHVPLLIHWSGHLAPQRISRVTSLRELPKMIMALTQGKTPEQFLDACPDCRVFAENYRPLYYIARLKSKCLPGKDINFLDRRQKALITSDYKLIWDSKGEHRFFDLQADPLEKQDLIGQNVPAFETMKTKMDIFIAEGVSPHIASSRSIDRETDRALKALGYAR